MSTQNKRRPQGANNVPAAPSFITGMRPVGIQVMPIRVTPLPTQKEVPWKFQLVRGNDFTFTIEGNVAVKEMFINDVKIRDEMREIVRYQMLAFQCALNRTSGGHRITIYRVHKLNQATNRFEGAPMFFLVVPHELAKSLGSMKVATTDETLITALPEVVHVEEPVAADTPSSDGEAMTAAATEPAPEPVAAKVESAAPAAQPEKPKRGLKIGR